MERLYLKLWKQYLAEAADDKSILDIVRDCSKNRIIRRGMVNNDVKYIQDKLSAAGEKYKNLLGTYGSDGIFGAKTFAAVKQFQTDKGLKKIDGKVGCETLAALESNEVSKNLSAVSAPTTKPVTSTKSSTPSSASTKSSTSNKSTKPSTSNKSTKSWTTGNAAADRAIAKLSTKYGINITQTLIDNEFKQGEKIRTDNGPNSTAKAAIKKLTKAAQAEFPNLKLTIEPVSGYRSYDDQVKNFGGKVASGRSVENVQRSVALPGFSEHHTGKAFDIFSVETDWWDNRPALKSWVATNAGEYGFDVTYKKQGYLRIAEPWHLFYVGK